MRLTLNYSVCTLISAYTHPCDTNTFTHSITRMHLLQLKVRNIQIKFFLKSKKFPFSYNRNFNTKIIHTLLFLTKPSADINDIHALIQRLKEVSQTDQVPVFPLTAAWISTSTSVIIFVALSTLARWLGARSVEN